MVSSISFPPWLTTKQLTGNPSSVLRGESGWGVKAWKGLLRNRYKGRSARMDHKSIDNLIKWKVYDVLDIKERRQKGEHDMQYQFSIELRVDFEDKDKVQIMKNKILSDARGMLATAKLLNDKVEPTIACFSDDFFHGQNELNLYEDLKVEGEKQLTGVTSKLLEALK